LNVYLIFLVNLFPSIKSYIFFPLFYKKLRNIGDALSDIELVAKFKTLKTVFFTKNLPLAVYLIYKTKGTGYYGAPFFLFLFLYIT